MLRFGMCGCGGFIEKGVLPAMADADNAQAVAIFDVNADRLKHLGEQFSIEKRFEKYEDLLACNEVDVVYIASPNAFHKDQVIAAAQAGRHIFCQKPMGLNADECREMLAAVEATGVKMGMGFCFRYAGAQHDKNRTQTQELLEKAAESINTSIAKGKETDPDEALGNELYELVTQATAELGIESPAMV